jgi:hypothetical protein
MADKDKELTLLSDAELEARLKTTPASKQSAAEEKPYTGPERRRGGDRRKGNNDRRAMLRFEPDKDKADRRDANDRRKANRKPSDVWKNRDS